MRGTNIVVPHLGKLPYRAWSLDFSAPHTVILKNLSLGFWIRGSGWRGVGHSHLTMITRCNDVHWQ